MSYLEKRDHELLGAHYMFTVVSSLNIEYFSYNFALFIIWTLYFLAQTTALWQTQTRQPESHWEAPEALPGWPLWPWYVLPKKRQALCIVAAKELVWQLYLHHWFCGARGSDMFWLKMIYCHLIIMHWIYRMNLMTCTISYILHAMWWPISRCDRQHLVTWGINIAIIGWIAAGWWIIPDTYHIGLTVWGPHMGHHSNRVLHTLDVVADNILTGHFRLARPHWNNMARLSCHAKYPNPLQIYGWVICFEINCTWKQMSHRVMFAYWCWSEI